LESRPSIQASEIIFSPFILNDAKTGIITPLDGPNMTPEQEKRLQQLKSDPDIVQMRILIWGEGGVGCTTTILKMLFRVMMTEYDPTIIDEYQLLFKRVGPERKTVLLTLVDLAGQEEFVCKILQFLQCYSQPRCG
jgi:hypothetical protein